MNNALSFLLGFLVGVIVTLILILLAVDDPSVLGF